MEVGCISTTLAMVVGVDDIICVVVFEKVILVLWVVEHGSESAA